MYLPMPVFALALIVITHSSLPVCGLVAYNCEDSRVNKATISLVETPPCVRAKRQSQTEKVDVILSQPTGTDTLVVLSCLVEVDHLVYRCGKTFETHHGNGFYAEIPTITEVDCKRMHNEGLYVKTHIKQVIAEVRPGVNFFTQTTAGSVSEGTCDHHETGLTLNGIFYDRPVRQSKFRVTIAKVTATVDYETSRLVFPDGTYCPYLEETCFTMQHGNSFWEVKVPTCSDADDHAIVYKGGANRVTELVGNHTTTTYHVNNGVDDFFITRREERTTLCGFPTYYTEHPKMFITEMVNGAVFPNMAKVTKSDVDLVSYINSKLVYVMRHTKSQVDELYNIMANERCLTENRVTQNMMTLAILSPTEFAYQYTGQPGHTAVVRGEVAHLFQCHPVSVQFTGSTNGCFNEMVVTHNNVTKYMMPRSRILTNVGTQIDCNFEVASQFLIDGQWVQSTPHGVIEVKAAKVITNEMEVFEFKPIRSFSVGGMYSDSMITQAMKIITKPPEQVAMQVNLIRAISGEGALPSGYSITNGFGPIDLNMMKGKVSDWFTETYQSISNVGSICAFLLVVGFIFRSVTTILNGFINFKVLRDNFGSCLACLCFWWDSMAAHMMNGHVNPPFQKKKADEETVITIQELNNLPLPGKASIYPPLS